MFFGFSHQVHPPGRGLSSSFSSAPSAPPQRECPSLVCLSLRAVCAPFFLDAGERKEEHKKTLTKIVRRVSDKKELKALLFSEFLKQGTLDRLLLSGFSASKGGFLTHLDLTSTKVTNQSLSLVGSIRTLSILILRSCNNFDDGGLSSLVRGGCASKLKMLDLSKCRKITDSGLSHLRSLVQLRTLDLSDLLITDTGVSELQYLPNLQQLSLSRTRVGDGAFESMAQDFINNNKRRKGLISLKVLKLRSLNLTEAGILQLAHFPSLAIADLFGCWPAEDIWDEFLEKLQLGRKSCVIHRQTGKLVIGPEGVERSTIEKGNLWKFPTNPHLEWNVRRLVALLQGQSGPSPSPPRSSPFTPQKVSSRSPFPSPFGSPNTNKPLHLPFQSSSSIHSRFMSSKPLIPPPSAATSLGNSSTTRPFMPIPKEAKRLPSRLFLNPIPPSASQCTTKKSPSSTSSTKRVSRLSVTQDKPKSKPLQERVRNENVKREPATRKRTRKTRIEEGNKEEKQEKGPSQKKRKCIGNEGENGDPPSSSTRRTTTRKTTTTSTKPATTKATTTKTTKRTTRRSPELQVALLQSQMELERIRKVVAEKERERGLV